MKNKEIIMLNLKKIVELICIILILFLILDYFDIPSIIIARYWIYGISLIFLIVLFVILNKKIMGLFELNIYNSFDKVSISLGCSVFIYQIFSIYVSNTCFKQSILCIGFLLIECIVYTRLILFYITERNVKEEYVNVYDLQDLYKGKISSDRKELIFLEEKDAKYDLLNRGNIINSLYNNINNCKNESCFILSLTGKWGCGKTTILNIVKKKISKDEYIVIDDFDVWKYNNEKMLFFAMFDEILQRTGINFSFIEVKRFVNICTNIVTSNSDIDINFLNSEKEVIHTIKDTIKNYLIKNNKRIVFIIDNLERTNEENILIILKTICTILNLDRTIYVLSYDEDEMKEVFENKLHIDYDYIEKVVQLPLKVPEVSKDEIRNVCTVCLKNLLRYYVFSEENIKKYEVGIELFNDRVKDLRSFKRKLNSILNLNFYTNNYLNILDSILLELIRDENIELYRSIKENYKRYVSVDQPTVYGFSYENAKKYNKETTEYFDLLFNIDENKLYEDILKYLFPNVNRYFTSRKNFEGYIEFWDESMRLVSKDKSEYINSNIERRIYNAKFFDLYFTKSENIFIEIDEKAVSLIKTLNEKEYDMNSKEDVKKLEDAIFGLTYMIKDSGQKYIFEILEFHVSEIKNNKLMLLMYLLAINDKTNDTMLFLGINAKERLQIVCKEIIKILSEDELNKLKKFIEIDYKDIYFWRGILSWLNPDDNYKEDEILYTKIKESYDVLLENISKNQINLYDNKYYSQYNIYCLLDSEMHKEQIKNINSNNVCLFMADIVSKSYGTNGYGYSITKENLEKFIAEEELDEILKDVDKTTLNEKEKFILEVYDKFKERNVDIHDRAIYTDSYIDLRNISDIN